MGKRFRLFAAAILILAIILSCTVMGKKLTDPATYSHTIEVLDKNRATVLRLSAASAAASAAVSALPKDIGSSISSELSDFTLWFTIILGFTYLEKYLLTVLGGAACYILFPLGCGILLISCFLKKKTLTNIGTKFILFGLILILMIPSSIWVSDHINETYSESIEMTIESAGAAGDSLISEVATEEEDIPILSGLKSTIDSITDSVSNTIEQFKNLLNQFVEATAVLVVTTCVIPILVVLLFLWSFKNLFNVPITAPSHLFNPRRDRNFRDYEDEREFSLTR